MTLQNIQNTLNHSDIPKLKTVKLQQTNMEDIYDDDDDNIPLGRYLLHNAAQNKKWTSQQKIGYQIDEYINPDDEDVLPIGIVHDLKVNGLHQCLSAAEKYKNRILRQDPELKSVLSKRHKTDIDQNFLYLDQYYNKCNDESADADDDIPLIQAYYSILKKTSNV